MSVFRIITLLTDFGLSDPYVGIMKCVILSINPEVHLIDISHQIRPGSIHEGAQNLIDALPFFPRGSIHLAVVDPGVGGDRRPIAVKTEHHFFVGPDNGLFWPVITSHRNVEIFHLTESKFFLSPLSSTFHGRDIFAPVAAYLSVGVDLKGMGVPITDPVPLHLPKPTIKGDRLEGQIVRVDQFGNLITNIHRKDLKDFVGSDQPVIRVGDLQITGLSSCYAESKEGSILAIIDSSDRLEIAVRSGRACDLLPCGLEEIVGLGVEVSRIHISSA